MSQLQWLRAYHAVLACLVAATYLSGEAGLIHALLGYLVALVILGRITAAWTGLPTLGLARFYPSFEGLRLDSAFAHPAISRVLLAGIAVCLIGATATGLALDRGQSIGVAQNPLATVAHAESREREHGRTTRFTAMEEREGGSLGEAHEGLSNALVVLVGLHIAYLLLFKRKLAHFMLFLAPRGRHETRDERPAQAKLPVLSHPAQPDA
jgi:cytochrome b